MNRKQNGMTIIELVLTISLLALMSVTIAVIAINYKSSYIEIASQKIRSDIEHARSLAMTKKGTVFGVYFNNTSNEYIVYEASSATPVDDPQTKQPLIENFSKWPSVNITGSDYTVEFNEFGAPTLGGGGSVSISDGSVTKAISVDAGTGRVAIN